MEDFDDETMLKSLRTREMNRELEGYDEDMDFDEDYSDYSDDDSDYEQPIKKKRNKRPSSNGEKKRQRKGKKDDNPVDVKKEFLSWIKIIIGSFLVAVILTNFVIVNAKIPTGSMISTINKGDHVIGFRLAYLFSKPQRGDIVMFYAPEAAGEDQKGTIYVKRVIGLPGETVKLSNNKVYINGEQIEEDYVKNGWTIDEDTKEYVIPKGCYFMMGDNRDHSSDSRVWGCVKKKDIIAKALFKYFPKIKSLN